MNNTIIPLNEQTAIEKVKVLANIVRSLRDEVFQPGLDFGVIPGTGDKPTLLLPGMEKLLRALHLRPEYHAETIVEDFDKGLFHYRYECRLIEIDSGLCIATAKGSCNSMESKYRWRWVTAEHVPQGVNKDLLETRNATFSEFAFAIDKAETTGKYAKPESYWKMFQDAISDGAARAIKRKTATGKEMDAWEIGGLQYRIANTDIFDQVNTIDKIAQKRALASAIKGAANVSEYYTVDLEDFPHYQTASADVVEGQFVEVTSTPTPEPEKPAGELPKHWSDNGGRERFLRRMSALGLDLETVKASLEPKRKLEKLSDTTLTEDQAMIRLDEMAEGQKSGVAKEIDY